MESVPGPDATRGPRNGPEPMDEDSAPISLNTATSTSLLEGLGERDNRTIWHQFVERYRPMIAGYAHRMGLGSEDAEDAAQATLIAFCEAYQAGRYEREKGRLRSWLFGIARNQIRNTMKKRRHREVQVVGDSRQTDFFARIEDGDELEQLWDQQWRDAVLRQCMAEVRNEVDAQSIEAFELFARQGWSAQKVADHLGMTANAVFLVKHRILKRIRELMPRMEEIW